jgi:tryptophan synthase alpha chain
MTERLARTFHSLHQRRRTALVSFTMAGDPDLAASERILHALPGSGVDIIELGMPFSDPTADGPVIQAAGVRALASGVHTRDILAMVRRFRAAHPEVPLVLMGYYNPILRYGPEHFAQDAAAAGVDALIVVDLPPEEEEELRAPMRASGLDLVRLIAPTTDDARLETLLASASGFVYTIAVKGITGTHSAEEGELRARIEHIRSKTALPVVAGFGIRTPQQAAALAGVADGVVIGSAIVERIASGGVAEVQEFARALSSALEASG